MMRGNLDKACVLCRGKEADADLDRIHVWEDQHWRLTTSLSSEVLGFSYLEPHRHVPDVTALGGEEAETLGLVLSRVTRALREITKCEQVYVYVFGEGVDHLHLHLAPHHQGDALSDQIIRGELVEEKLESGAVRYESKDFPLIPETDQRDVVSRLKDIL